MGKHICTCVCNYIYIHTTICVPSTHANTSNSKTRFTSQPCGRWVVETKIASEVGVTEGKFYSKISNKKSVKPKRS